MSQGELADRRTARGRCPAGTEAHHALLQDEATRNFVSSKTVLNQKHSNTFSNRYRAQSIPAHGTPSRRSTPRKIAAKIMPSRPVITGGKIAAVGIDQSRRIREGRYDAIKVKFAVGVRLRRQRKSRSFRLEDDLSVSHRTMLGIVHKSSHSPENRRTLKSKQPAIKKTRQEDTTRRHDKKTQPAHTRLRIFF
jgi:hypothetical protein